MRAALRWISGLVVVAVLAGLAYYQFFDDHGGSEFSARFSRSTGLYVGDDVRIEGVRVGTVQSVTPHPQYVTVTFHLNSGVDLPQHVKAAIVSPNVVTSRFVQLTPAYVKGPQLASGSTITDTAVPVEWNEVETQLTRLATSLGPSIRDKKGALSGAVDVADANLTGTAAKLHDMLGAMSDATSTLAANRGNLFGTIRGLQSFVSNLVRSDSSVRSFATQLNDASSLLDTEKGSLGAALKELDQAVGEVTQFVKGNRSGVKSTIGSLKTLSDIIINKQQQLELLLHVGPTGLANFYNIIDPRYHAATGVLSIANFDNLASLVCGMVLGATGSSDTGPCLTLLNPLFNALKGLPSLGLPIPLGKQGAQPTTTVPTTNQGGGAPTTGSGSTGGGLITGTTSPVGQVLGLLLPGGSP